MNEEIIDNLNKRLDEAVDRGRKIIEEEDLAEKLEDVQQRTEFMIRKYPLKSLAAGVFAGFVLGKIFSSDD